MKFIKLECSTRGEKSGAILPVGGEGEISVEEAQILVAEKMATEYVAPSTGGSDAGCAELKAELASANEELASANEELRKGKVGELKASVKELEGQVKSLTEQNKALTDQVALFTAGGE